jgi:hypothetical protein
MTAPRHTPEPWTAGGCSIYDANGHFVAELSEACLLGHTADQVEANTNHIAACVNALAGKDPEGVADAVEAFRAIIERWDTPLWKDAEPTAVVIARGRAALAKLEGK